MRSARAIAAAALAALSLMTPAQAGEIVDVTVFGQVEFNQITAPPLGLAKTGDPAELSFSVDSDVFVNSGSFPTRGYEINRSSFKLTLGSTSIGLQSPYPAGQTPYFVLRNNDPAVDGFFVANSVDFPTGVQLNQTGAFSQFMNNYSVGYVGTTLSSLNILDALGTYDFNGLTSFNWTIDDGPFNAMGIVFSKMTIVPEPATVAMLLLLGLAGRRRR